MSNLQTKQPRLWHLVWLLLCSMTLSAAPCVHRVEPLCWWTDMQCPLTLMLYGEDLQDAQVSVQTLHRGRPMRGSSEGLIVRGQHNAESANYLFVDMDVREPGTYRITLTKDKKRATYDYVIHPRSAESRQRTSFSSADVVYLIMSDRFVDGDTTNNTVPTMREAADKQNIHGRWGGDIAGIIESLDHISQLGATAIWPTPLLCDNEEKFSYHGYACSDYYHIDPRFGDNALYCQMVAEAHKRGLKVLMDMVPNHCGTAHWWMKDLPYRDWINQWEEYTSTNNIFSANYDIHASAYDREHNNSAWFDHTMADINLRNRDVLHYFTQWAIWWVEYAQLDGLRVDTYPYLEPQPASEWLAAIRTEYPNLNIVGECWTRPASAVAYWQDGTPNFNGFRSHLPSVMDFPLNEAIRQALGDDGKSWGGGMMKVYDVLASDYVYPNTDNLLIFAGNHDMDRITDVVKDADPRRVKIAMTLIATLRGIPQLFAGDEYALRSSDMSKGHSTLRMPLPQADTLTAEQKDMMDYQSRLFQFRKTEPILHTGKLMHFAGRDNTYAFFRYTDEGAVFVYINASDEERTIPTAHYAEILSRYNPVGTEVIRPNAPTVPTPNATIDLSREDIVAAPLSACVIKLNKKQ